VLDACSKILEPANNFFVLNLYSLGYSPIVSNNLIESYFTSREKTFGESFLRSQSGIDLPLGTYVRFRN
jgi:23S rRNA (cytosine1962-C5)-methyltransferase